jgi:hypothetical protein
LIDGRSVPSWTTCEAWRRRCFGIACCCNFQAEADGHDADQLIGRLLEACQWGDRVSVTRVLSPSAVGAIDDLELAAA